MWPTDVAECGYVTHEVYLNILSDLDEHLTANDIPRPMLLYVDGYKVRYLFSTGCPKKTLCIVLMREFCSIK